MRDFFIIALLVLAFFMARYYKTWVQREKKLAEEEGRIFDIWSKLGGLIPMLACLLIALYLFVT